MDQGKKAAEKKSASPKLVKFRTGFGGAIEPVDVIRETEACVYLPVSRRGFPGASGKTERREAKRSDYAQYHNTWEDAKTYLIERAEAKVLRIRRQMEGAEDELGNIKGMKKPKEFE